jgi:peptidyl-prolyl cis-trans isomerase D
MLTLMRSGLNSFFVVFLLGVLISSFAIWGIGDIFTSRSLSVAEVGDKEISSEQYLREFQNRLRNFQAQFGPEFDTERAVSLGVHRIVLDEIIQRTSLDEEARELGLVGSPLNVTKAIREMDVFFDPSGKFNLYNYQQALISAGITEQTFEESMLKEHARAQLVETIMTANPVPKALVDTLYTFRKEKRRAKILNIQSSDVGTIEAPDEATLLSHFEQYENFFMYPEFRDLQILVIDPLSFSNEMEFSEDELLEAYDERTGQYYTPEMRELQLLVLDDQQTAQAVYERTQQGESLVDIGMDLLGFSIEDVNIGEMDKYSLELDYNEVASERVFELVEGGVSQPIQTMFGWHVFQVSNISPAIEILYADVREDLIKELSSIAGYDAVYSLVEGIEDSLAAGNDFESILEENGLSATHLSEVDRNGLNKEGFMTAEASTLLPYIADGFSSLPGDELIMQSFGEAGFYLVQVNEVFPAVVREFQEVENGVRASWYSNERILRAGEMANQALLEAQAGVSIEEIAKKFSADVVETDILQRDQSRGNLEIARPIFDLIYSLDKGEFDLERSSTNDGYLLVGVTMIAPGIPNENDPAYQALKQTLSSEISQGLLTEYQRAVAISLGVDVNSQLLEDLFTGGVIGTNIPGQF